jgi:ethanolamine utilization protein EutQ (cupin superfamily)
MGKTDTIYIAVVNSRMGYNMARTSTGAVKGISCTDLVTYDSSTDFGITYIVCRNYTVMATTISGVI